MKYIKELDSLRAIAICCVLTTHWLPADNIFRSVSSAISAPHVFFTLSGFLITKILLADRLKAEASGSSKLVVFRNFFLKRALRTFPAYYLIICIDYLLSDHTLTHYIGYLTYTANIHQYLTHEWGPLPHLWSMSVEQQFYLIWPWFILFIPQRFLIHLILCFIGIGVLSHQLIPLDHFAFVLPYTCFDTLGFGALLAWLVSFKSDVLEKWYPVIVVAASISIVLIVLQPSVANLYYRNNRTLVAIVVFWLISYFILQKGSNYVKLHAMINSSVLILTGKISYGIYLYHLTIFTYSYLVFFELNSRLPLPEFVQNNYYLYVFENFILVLGIAWLSWKFFELPFSDLKRYLINPSKIIPSVKA